MNYGLIVGNVCTVLAMACNAISSAGRSPKKVLWMQSASQAIYGISGIALQGYSATVQNVVSILRNLAAIRNMKSKVLEWALVVLGVVLGVACNNRGVIGLLPVIGNLQYTLAIFKFKTDERKIKIFFLISTVCFVVFNFAICNYVGALADAVVSVTTATMIWKDFRRKEKKA